MLKKPRLSNCISNDALARLEQAKQKLEEESQLAIGCVHLMLLDEEDDIVVPEGEVYHPKMIVILGYDKETDEYIGNVFINSKINDNIYYTEESKADHYPLYRKDYPKLIKEGHDPSYINCSTVKRYSKKRILSEKKYLGKLKETDIKGIVSVIEKSKQLTPKIKKKYGFEDKSR